MDERQIGLALTLKQVGIDSDISGFESRLILQKTVYLLEEAGIRLGYSFNWYLRGPYSPGLTRDLYNLKSSNEDVAGWVLDERSQSIASRLQPLISRPNEDASSRAKRLELLASLHYLSHRRHHLDLSNPEQAREQLAKNGKHFTGEQVADAMRTLKQFSLL